MKYRDPGLPVAERVEDLLGRMTLEEKAAQMVQVPYSEHPSDVSRMWAQRLSEDIKGKT